MTKERLATELDATTPADLPDEVWLAAGITREQLEKIKKLPVIEISSMIPLVMELGKCATKKIVKNIPIEFEINADGERRCVYTSDGVRCAKYGTKNIPVCAKHIERITMVGHFFRSPKLREMYQRFATDKEKMSCDGELAMMRTMLASLIEKVDETNLNIEVIASITAMCDKITVVVDRMSKLEKITPEQLNILMQRMVAISATYIPADKLEAFAKEVEVLSVSGATPTMEGKFLPGEEVKQLDGSIETITVRKALLDVAQQMGVTQSGD